jgi:hypothetical protein
MPQHVRGDNLGPVRQYTLGARERPRAGSHGDQDLRGLRPGSGRPCPGCRHGLLSRTECACASIAYGVRWRLGDEITKYAQLRTGVTAR